MPDPRITMQTHVHPKAMLVDTAERLVSVRLDLNAPTESEGVVTRPLNLALVIDKSGSMSGQKIETAKAAAARVVDRLADEDTFTLVAFSSEAEVLVPACRVGNQRRDIAARISRLGPESATLLAKGMRAAADQIGAHCRDGVASSMFILTDGEAQDQAECLGLAPGIVQRGISIYAGGIGEQYNHAFLEKLCADPVEQGKFLVDHIDLSTLDRMGNLFESYLKRKGHVVTSNVRLFVTFPRRVNLRSVQAEEHAQAIQLDAQQSFPVADLYAGKQQRYLFEFVTTPSAAGNMQLARFRLRYDLPASNVRQAEAEVDAIIEITEDPSRANIPNSKVLQVAKKLQATKLSEAAEADLARKDIRGATKKLERVTRALEELGEHDQAREVKERATALEQSDPQNLDLEIKRLRGTTKRLSE
jgi:Ca-activated chloride channel family protein